MGGVEPPSPYRFVSMSEPVTWVAVRREHGCWKCRLRVFVHWPRPFRHFGCGPAVDPFPGMARLEDLL